MAKRKRIVQNRAQLSNLLTRIEGGKSQAKVGDIRQVMKLLVEVETVAILSTCASVVMPIRREAREKAAKIRARYKRNKRSKK